MNILSYASKYIWDLNRDLSPKLPDNIIIFQDNNWNSSNIVEWLQEKISEKNCVFYIWPFYKSKDWEVDNGSTYNIELIEWIIDHIIIGLKKWRKVKIKIASQVWFACKNYDDESLVFDSETQERNIRTILQKKIWDKWRDKVTIEQIWLTHQELLDEIKGIDETNINDRLWEWSVTLEKENISSLDIAKLLYRAYIEVPQLRKDIEETMTRNSKNKFYSLYELAIRIVDLINWEDIQWTTETSNKVNKIFYNIINWKKYNSDSLRKIHEYVSKARGVAKIWENKLIWVVINKKTLRKHNWLVRKKKERIKKLIQRIALSVSIILWAWSSWYMLNEHKQNLEEQRIEERIWQEEEIFLKQMFHTLGTEQYLWIASQQYIDINSIEILVSTFSGAIDKSIEIFKYRYWDNVVEDKKLRRSMIRCAISIYSWNVQWFNRFIAYSNNSSEIPFFIDKCLVFLPEWTDIDSYWRLWKYKTEALNTLSYEWRKETFEHKTIELWKYTTREWIEYYIWITECSIQIPLSRNHCWYDWLLVAKQRYHEKYNIEEWKKVSIDILWNIYLKRLVNRINNIFIKAFLKDSSYADLEELIIEDLIKNEWLTNIDMYLNWSNERIIEYLKTFIVRNKNKLSEKWIEVHENPYDSFKKYKQLFQEKLEGDNIKYSSAEHGIDEYLWSYYDDNWDEYLIYHRIKEWEDIIIINRLSGNTYIKIDRKPQGREVVEVLSYSIEKNKIRQIIETILSYLE